MEYIEGGILRGRKIGRTIGITHCYGQRVRDGEFVDFSPGLYGKHSLKAAQNYLRKKLKDDTITILNAEYKQYYYEMDLNDFMRNATYKGETND